MPDRLDPNRLRLQVGAPLPSPHRRSTFPRTRRGRFLKGPIPWVWLSAAARLPGRALHVAIEIRLWAGIKRTNRFAFSVSGLTALGVSRSAGHRGLAALEGEGLISVDRRRGRKPRVTLIEIDTGTEPVDSSVAIGRESEHTGDTGLRGADPRGIGSEENRG